MEFGQSPSHKNFGIWFTVTLLLYGTGTDIFYGTLITVCSITDIFYCILFTGLRPGLQAPVQSHRYQLGALAKYR